AVVTVMRLHDEDVAASNAFTEAWANLTVGELDDIGFAECDVQVTRNLTRQLRMRTTAVEHHPLGGDFVDRLVHCEPA
ncbi:MAG: hypothetical protein RLZZ332_956, partial [Actinomycetota bacterium]